LFLELLKFIDYFLQSWVVIFNVKIYGLVYFPLKSDRVVILNVETNRFAYFPLKSDRVVILNVETNRLFFSLRSDWVVILNVETNRFAYFPLKSDRVVILDVDTNRLFFFSLRWLSETWNLTFFRFFMDGWQLFALIILVNASRLFVYSTYNFRSIVHSFMFFYNRYYVRIRLFNQLL